jgi:hypothetical protein
MILQQRTVKAGIQCLQQGSEILGLFLSFCSRIALDPENTGWKCAVLGVRQVLAVEDLLRIGVEPRFRWRMSHHGSYVVCGMR